MLKKKFLLNIKFLVFISLLLDFFSLLIIIPYLLITNINITPFINILKRVIKYLEKSLDNIITLLYYYFKNYVLKSFYYFFYREEFRYIIETNYSTLTRYK